MSLRAKIAGLGASLPERKLTNFDLEKLVETSDEWIRTRTGIQERRIAEKELNASDYGLVAAREALARAGADPRELDLILVATSTPDMAFPSTACIIQQALGASKAAAFDIAAACSGFVYALTTGSQFIETGMYRNVLVIGVDLLTRLVDYRDRSTCILFGDGCGAALLQPTESDDGILASYLCSDGTGADLLYVSNQEDGEYIRMKGSEVFRFAVKAMGDAAELALSKAGLSPEDVHLFVPHQANVRIIEASAKRFGWPMEKVVVNIDRYGNTSAASIPVALYEAERAGRIHRGDNILLVAVGGGLTWGASVIRW